MARTIEGTVLDHEGHPVPGAVVLIEDLKTLQVRSYIVQQDGQVPLSRSQFRRELSIARALEWRVERRQNGQCFPKQAHDYRQSQTVAETDASSPAAFLRKPFVTHSQILQKIKELAIVPIVRTPDEGSALAAVEAVYAGGIHCVEITMTVANALQGD